MPDMDCDHLSEHTVTLVTGGKSVGFNATCIDIQEKTEEKGRLMFLRGNPLVYTKFFFANDVTAKARTKTGKVVLYTFSGHGSDEAILSVHEEFSLIKAQNTKP